MIRPDLPFKNMPMPAVAPPAPPAPTDHGSMALRDHLAAQVMTVLVQKECSERWDCTRWARWSYEMADAMLEARRK